ncbi:MAG: hypothetical protein F4138_07595 [Acidimicrobiia bacterium]|nr:hypothetical protein [Acidimicrobiia bacterium]MYC57535.1 hypothetical protein [Acidimicrobiia bacterium]MYG94826.1 hypothetical protein [Acidimicrobiia bacterium]MYI30101.1 hypothetical protein [Acidimicrobiia bacterium]
MNSSGGCAGRPDQCEFSRHLISSALDGQPTLAIINHVRMELSNCTACMQILEVEIQYKLAMSQACRESAPESLQIRISESLQRIVLDDLEISDF